ncbi:4-hydroxy-tetrahydrodipicolinate synthase [Candidatus Lokiarchaeum ossiferum]|uniref:4-hydroxy-tetrahydrodipicolinate synthase n=1 Tax=Candidatus Lokiarchaeum ossiferum TaxID=2951803 RepID=A0ABY6HPK0_9ARCH|nr:4-hydroxy-tetrahydrodipicolinate synthase [Candidatus Lokiarchaeum sp. B-35]
MNLNISKLNGAFSALISPMDDDGDLCKSTYRNFIRRQIRAGCGLVPCGTTGESATMSHQEHENVIRWCVEEAQRSNEKPFVLAGAGSNNTKEAISLSRHAERMGVDGVLLITPYYNKPTQKGLYAHYAAIASEINIPIVVYNCPGRTGGNILPQTVQSLSEDYANIIGYKAASGNLAQIQKVINLTHDNFVVLSGDDSLTYEIMKSGGKGVISVASNLIPERMVQFVQLMTNNQWSEARIEHNLLQDLFHNLFIETNPAPAKYGAEILNLMSSRVRLPLVGLEPSSKTIMRSTLENLSLQINQK